VQLQLVESLLETRLLRVHWLDVSDLINFSLSENLLSKIQNLKRKITGI